MKDKNKTSEPKGRNTNADYNPTDRDFQRTEEDIDDISKSEKENKNKTENQRTERGNTTPDKNKIN